MIALINTQRTLANLHKAVMLQAMNKVAGQDTKELEEEVDSVTSILVLYLKEHTPIVNQAQFQIINRFNDWVEREAKRRLA
jgi:hypothetical protein